MPGPDEPRARGRAGASAHREYARRKQNREQAVRDRHPHIGGLLIAVSTEPRSEQAWRHGAEGEERVGAQLARHLGTSAILLHDRRIPRSRANIDHVVIAPSGVWVIDAKRYHGRVEVRQPLLGAPKLTIAGRDRSKLADGLARQVSLVNATLHAVAPEVPTYGAFCFVDAQLPIFASLTFRDFVLMYPRQLARRTNQPGPLSPARISDAAQLLAASFPAGA